MSDIAPGCQILVAPNFPPLADWSHRVRLSSGVTIEGDHAFPRPPWREPTADELATLVRDPNLPLTQADLDASLALLTLPQHLMTVWWQLLEQATGAGGLVGFDGFLRQVCDFLTFKNLLLQEELAGEVIACPPGRSSLRTDPATNAPSGLGSSRPLWGLINLGDEADLVFVNARVDLDADPDYPVVALRLNPGEGCRLPDAGILCDSHNPEPDSAQVWLMLQIS